KTTLVSPPCLAQSRLWVGTSGDTLIELEPQTLAHITGLPLPANMTACPVDFDGLLAVPTRGWEGRLLLYRAGVSAPLASVRLDSRLWASPLAGGKELWAPSHD